MSDAQVDGGDAGQKGEDIANGIIGNLSNEQAANWYGMVSGLSSAIAAGLWILLNQDYYYVAALESFFLAHLFSFVPVSMTWFMMMFFPDNAFIQTVYYMLVTVSISGPFFLYWSEIITIVTWGEFTGDDGDLTEPTAWDELMFYVAVASMVSVTIFEMIMQVTILPQVFSWAEEVETLGMSELIYV